MVNRKKILALMLAFVMILPFVPLMPAMEASSETEKQLTGIEITSKPTKLEYIQGEEFDPTGLEVSITYDSGEKRTLESSEYTIYGYDSTPGIKTMTVEYLDKTTTFEVTVINPSVTGIELIPPTKKTYLQSDTEIDTTGIKVTAFYSNGKSQVLSSDEYRVTGFDPTMTGSQPITVRYSGFEKVFYIWVDSSDLTDIEVTPPNKIEYVEGEEFNPTGMVVTAVYGTGINEKRKEVDVYEISYDLSLIGYQNVYVTYGGISKPFIINISKKELTHIVVTPPARTTFYEGEEFDTTGMVVTAWYNNGKSEVVKPDLVSGYDSKTTGTKLITVMYNGMKDEFSVVVTVDRNLSSLVCDMVFSTPPYVDANDSTLMNGTLKITNKLTEDLPVTIIVAAYHSYTNEMVGRIIITEKILKSGVNENINVYTRVGTQIGIENCYFKVFLIGDFFPVAKTLQADSGLCATSSSYSNDTHNAMAETESVSCSMYSTVSKADGKTTITTNISNAQAGEQVFVMLFKPDADLTDGIQENEIAYIDQKAADSNGSVTFIMPIGETRAGDTYRLLAGTETAEAAIVENIEIGGGEEAIHYGDVNGDGQINNVDAFCIYRYLLGTHELDAEALTRADVNVDGVVNNRDIENILRYFVGHDHEMHLEWNTWYGGGTGSWKAPDNVLESKIKLEQLTWGYKAGDTVKIAVVLDENPGYASIIMSLKYDAEVLSVVDTDVYDGFIDSANILDSRVMFGNVGRTHRDITKTGTMATVTFKLLKDITKEVPLTLVCDKDYLCNFDLNNNNNVSIENISLVPSDVAGITVTPPTKLTYIEGTELDTSDMTVKAVLTDGTERTITDYTVTGYDSSKIGQQTITVTYGNYSDTFTVTVTEAPAVEKQLTGIKITSKPTKLEYCQGEKFDNSGLIVTATYDDNTSKEITDYAVTGYDSSVIGKQTITVTYGGYSDTFTVNVSEITQLSAPKSNIKTSIIAKGTLLELTCENSMAEIYYTTDGSEPTEESNKYTEAIEINEDVTIKAKAFIQGVLSSETATFTYTVAAEIVSKLSSNYSNAGEEIAVTYSIKNNKGIASFTAQIDYNKDYFEPISIIKSDVLPGSFVGNPKNTDSSMLATWVQPSGINNDIDLFTATFKIKEGVSDKQLPITFEFTDEILNEEQQSIDVLTTDSSANVNVVLTGDVSSDGKIGTADTLKLAQYLAKYISVTMTEKEKKAADVYSDQKVNIKDLIQLMKNIVASPTTAGDTISLYSDDKPQVILKQQELANNQVAVTMQVSENTGFSGFDFIFDFDKEILKPVSISEGTMLSNKGMFESNMLEKSVELDALENITVIWGDVSSVTEESGELFTIVFEKLSDDATVIKFNDNTDSINGLVNSNNEDIKAQIQNTLYINQEAKIDSSFDEKNTNISVKDGNLTGDIAAVINVSDISQKQKVAAYVAIYNQNDELLNITAKDLELMLGNNTIAVENVSIAGIDGECKIKIFVWDDGTGTMKPLSVIDEYIVK